MKKAYSLIFLKRQALSVTAKDDRLIPMPAIQGFTNPIIATGMAITL